MINVKKNILVVEDSGIAALEIQRSLKKFEYNVHAVVSTGEQAILEAESNKIDLVIMDIKLTGTLDGIETAEILRRRFNIPVIFITAYSDEDTFERAKKSDPIGYIIKPFDQEALKTVVDLSFYRHSMETKIKQSEELFRSLVENSQDGIFILQDFRIIYTNDSLAEMTGIQIDKLVGSNFIDFIIEEDRTPFIQFYNKILACEPLSKEFDFSIYTKKNETIIVNLCSSVINYCSEKALMGTIKDITASRLAQQTLIKAARKLEKSDSLKSAFLSQMSHEIRTPVNNILNYIYLIKEDPETNKNIISHFNIIERSAKRLVRTIENILAFSQLQTGNYEIHPQSIDIEKDIMRRLLPEYIKDAAIKGIHLNYTKNSNGQRVNGDHYMLCEIISHLIDNAVKYTTKGSVDINQRLNESGNLVIEIKDTGIGISDEYIDTLFTPFSQEEIGYIRKYEGNGMGLALVKKYAELNNVDIKIESIKGCGTNFQLCFQH